jgi:hypothetical protein
VDQTETALADCLGQSIEGIRVLLVDQGSTADNFARVFSWQIDDRVYVWHHQPPLPSLAATWNRALRFVWSVTTGPAFVLNNDVRLHPRTLELLREVMYLSGAWFVSACNVGEPVWQQMMKDPQPVVLPSPESKGGPDFSCFRITRECHDQFPFDEHFVPAYCEDLDYHRRLMLAGHRDKIFSVPVPYLHYASGTLKGMSPEQRLITEQQITQGSRAYYEQKWGGPPNQETFRVPFGPEPVAGVTTPELQHGQETGRPASV